ncbi:hypothetical protein [Methylovorus sp. MP688]|uniref:hypothetical protein n=1 Tax=Methylovorus sp. (strain MP688) TaxID=887061 RepID=UPI0011D0808C|nr:hypothetical protein [Methylovorus sp. MP688]
MTKSPAASSGPTTATTALLNPGSVANQVTRYYYVDGKRVGDVSNDGASPTHYVQGMAARTAKSGNYAN